MTTPPKSVPLVSLVVPALNEADNVRPLLRQVQAHVEANPHVRFELVLVDDGSTDGTADLLLAAPTDFPIRLVQLSRNFGSHSAISAGLERCSGDCAVVIGADGQEPTTFVSDALEQWDGGFEVVWGVRKDRAAVSRGRQVTSGLFSVLFTRIAGLDNYPAEGPSGVLLDRSVITALGRLPERNRNVLALVAWLGYRQTRVSYSQLPRVSGESRWTRRAMVKLAVDSVLQFSSLPLRLCTLVGLITALLGVGYAALLVARTVAGVDTPSGWPTLLVVVLLLGGIQLTVVGVMGEYIWRIIEEVRHRPLYVVRRDITADASERDSRGAREGW
ncbi:glycosyltransferase family 2 protein [Nocardioides sp. HDW12B]|uniref:glycosyltransferase family 2 protein n=1 Tax=Nocardioides sp. HDW12B TaxID=2714939 RepID=UPI00140B59A6|nr:glycosyltransferase family 2 protein [Nocardioides sp. HDW12B]QIK66065.1 glycosyltransferase family 2 protein [Nocardioides sp. HDW12B]